MADHTENLIPRSIKAGDIEFGFLEDGPENGPLALCVHGFPDSAWTWRHLLPALAASGFHAVAPFLRGYAPTGLAVDGSYQSGALAADACALEEVLRGKDQSVVIGHDWGALAAYGAAGLAPERFRKVVTMALPPVAAAGATFFTYDQIKRSFYIFFFQLPFAEAAVAMDDLAFIDRLWADWSPGYDASWDVAKCKEAIGNPENLTAALSYYRATFDPSTHVAQYEEAQQASAGIPPQPTLYLHGERDGCIKTGPISDVEALLSGGSRAEMIESAGHFLHLEQPGRVEELVLEFLKP